MNASVIHHERKQDDAEVSHSLNFSCLWGFEMKMSSKQLDGQMLSFEERLGIESQRIEKDEIERTPWSNEEGQREDSFVEV